MKLATLLESSKGWIAYSTGEERIKDALSNTVLYNTHDAAHEEWYQRKNSFRPTFVASDRTIANISNAYIVYDTTGKTNRALFDDGKTGLSFYYMKTLSSLKLKIKELADDGKIAVWVNGYGYKIINVHEVDKYIQYAEVK